MTIEVPMDAIWLVRYSEIFLKSDPVRRQWEKTLVKNITEVLPDCAVRRERGRIWIEGPVDPEKLRKVFGIVSFSPCISCTLDTLVPAVLDLCRTGSIEASATFAVRVKRAGKHLFSSQDCAAALGAKIRAAFPHLEVDLDHPDKEIFVEIRDERCYIFDTVIRGSGGIPLGVEGTLVALMSGGIDSPVAAWMMMKRGCRIIPLYIALDGALDETNRAKAETVVEELSAYQPDISLVVLSDDYLARAKKVLRTLWAEKYTCLLCKRRMYRLAERIARERGVKGIVTGESLGQVASQTLDNLAVLTDAATMPIYRPLIGFDKEEVIRLAQEIGTFDRSIAPATSCRAVPYKPATTSSIAAIRSLEEAVAASGEGRAD